MLIRFHSIHIQNTLTSAEFTKPFHRNLVYMAPPAHMRTAQSVPRNQLKQLAPILIRPRPISKNLSRLVPVIHQQQSLYRNRGYPLRYKLVILTASVMSNNIPFSIKYVE